MNNPLNIVNTESCDSTTDNQETEHVPTVYWEGANCLIAGQPYYPKISSGSDVQGTEQFNTVTIILNGQTKSELQWNDQLELADKRKEDGYKILWKIDLGLFDRLPFSLLNKSQFMTLSIAIDHFLDHVWPKYEDVTIGMCLFEGSLDFSHSIHWGEDVLRDFRVWAEESYESIEDFNQETKRSFTSFEEMNATSMAGTDCIHLYTAGVCIDYLDILAGRIPDELACFVITDASTIASPLQQARLLNSERAEHIRFIIKKGKLPIQDISWNESFSPYGFYEKGADQGKSMEKPPLGVCLPEVARIPSSHYMGLNDAIQFLISQKTPFRVIPEALLTTEWDGLDELIVTSSGVSMWGLRKLQGFCAAGGTIVSIGHSLDVAEEIPFSEWQKKLKV